MTTYEDYKNENEAGEWIEDVFTTTVGELEEFGHGWDFLGKYDSDETIKIMITNRDGHLRALWLDSRDADHLNVETAIETIEVLGL